jgi:hypothetical protein
MNEPRADVSADDDSGIGHALGLGWPSSRWSWQGQTRPCTSRRGGTEVAPGEGTDACRRHQGIRGGGHLVGRTKVERSAPHAPDRSGRHLFSARPSLRWKGEGASRTRTERGVLLASQGALPQAIRNGRGRIPPHRPQARSDQLGCWEPRPRLRGGHRGIRPLVGQGEINRQQRRRDGDGPRAHRWCDPPRASAPSRPRRRACRATCRADR